MWHPLRSLEIVYGQQELWVGVTSVIYTSLVFLGGLALWWLFFWLLEYLVLGAERSTIWIFVHDQRNKRRVWAQRDRTARSNVTHIMLQGLFFGGVLLIFWIACASSGFNPWTTQAATLGMGIFLTYVFITPLGLFGSGLAVLASGLIERGQYWEFPGYAGYEGRIIAIWTLQVEMERWDEETQSGQIIMVPINMFLSGICKQNTYKQYNVPRVTRTENPHNKRTQNV